MLTLLVLKLVMVAISYRKDTCGVLRTEFRLKGARPLLGPLPYVSLSFFIHYHTLPYVLYDH